MLPVEEETGGGGSVSVTSRRICASAHKHAPPARPVAEPRRTLCQYLYFYPTHQVIDRNIDAPRRVRSGRGGRDSTLVSFSFLKLKLGDHANVRSQ
jgi:hypothetical protein